MAIWLRFRLLRFRHVYFQNAGSIRRLNRIAFHGPAGKKERVNLPATRSTRWYSTPLTAFKFFSPLSVREPSGTSTFEILFFHARQLGANEVLIFALQTRAHPSSARVVWFPPVDAPAESAFGKTLGRWYKNCAFAGTARQYCCMGFAQGAFKCQTEKLTHRVATFGLDYSVWHACSPFYLRDKLGLVALRWMIRARRRARSLHGASFFPTSDPRSIYSDKLRLLSSTSPRSAWSGIYLRWTSTRFPKAQGLVSSGTSTVTSSPISTWFKTPTRRRWLWPTNRIGRRG
jgi:hypothetical protein